jgi:hypothetical protein
MECPEKDAQHSRQAIGVIARTGCKEDCGIAILPYLEVT